MIIEAFDELDMIEDDTIEEDVDKQPLEEGFILTAKLKKYIADPNIQKYIREGNWEVVYRRVNKDDRIELTNVLLKSNINPLLKGQINEYGSRVPAFPVIQRGFFNGSNIKDLQITKGIEEIQHNAFSNCKNLTMIKFLSECDVTINSSAFSGCTNLTSVTIESSAKIYCQGTGGIFDGCSKLSSITYRGTIAEFKRNTNFVNDLNWLKGAPEAAFIKFSMESEKRDGQMTLKKFKERFGSTL